jgi:hypothetical protein
MQKAESLGEEIRPGGRMYQRFCPQYQLVERYDCFNLRASSWPKAPACSQWLYNFFTIRAEEFNASSSMPAAMSSYAARK